MDYYLSIDIGASSGRHILGYIKDQKLCLEEIYRFENGFKNENGSLVWDENALFYEVREGIKRCAEIGKIPKTVAIDTWGVDYVLLDSEKKVISPVFCYRDSRNEPMIKETERLVSFEELYAKSGIQKLTYNTLYQLFADKTAGRMEKARYFLMIPEYLSFKLTGVLKKEYTVASTTALVNAHTKAWDSEIIEKLGFKKSLFTELYAPSDEIGGFSEEIKEYVGFDSRVVFAPSHDTASAVVAAPLQSDGMYISSGTWSIIGLESEKPLISQEICKANFSNEGGAEYRFRFLKNYIGMWFLQSIRKNINKSLTYDEMMNMAKNSKNYRYFDVNDGRFLAPDNMIDAVRDYFGESEMPLDEVLASVYHSLAKSYANAVLEIERLTGKSIGAIHIVGGGCKDDYLNRLTSKYTGKTVTAGPVEATAVGNLISQLIFDGVCKDLTEARKLVKKSFDIFEINE